MHEEDEATARRALAGDEDAAESIRSRLEMLTRILSARTSHAIAREIAGDVISDCFGARHRTRGSGSDRILEDYHGQCSLDSWLARVALNRLTDRFRSGRERFEVAAAIDGETFDLPSPSPNPEPLTVEIERIVADALRHAFEAVPPLEVVILRLIHLHGITQREVAKTWGWDEPKVSRLVKKANATFKAETIGHLRERDQHLDLRWEDCVAICGQNPELLREL